MSFSMGVMAQNGNGQGSNGQGNNGQGNNGQGGNNQGGNNQNGNSQGGNNQDGNSQGGNNQDGNNKESKAILEKLNYGRASDDLLTKLPMEATVEIPDDFIPDYSLTEYFYLDDMSDEEIEEVIQRIADGKNVIFGDGVPLEHPSLDDTGFQPFWKSGSNLTHQWHTSRAFTILQNDKPTVYNWFMASERAAAIEFSDWPDNSETKNVNSWHFYHKPTGTNYWHNWFDTHTAKSRFTNWYNQAVIEGKKANWVTAAQHLGKAIHYLSDIGAPPHTGDRAISVLIPADPRNIALALNHSSYEQAAQDRRTQYAVSTANYYLWYTNNNTGSIADINIIISYGYYANCYSSNANLRNPTIEWPMKYTQQDVAGLLYKYYYDITGKRP